MKKYLVLLPVAAVFLSACNLQSSTTSTASPTPVAMAADPSSSPMMEPDSTPSTGNAMMAEGGVEVGGAMMVQNKNIVENAMMANNVTTVVAAVKAAGLAETLQGPGPFTVFAPTNAAFDKLPAGTVATLLKPENKADLVKILTYHVVPGRYTSENLKDGMKLKTVQGQEITISYKGGKWSVMDAKGGTAMIETADVISSNGVTFVLQSVLMPK